MPQQLERKYKWESSTPTITHLFLFFTPLVWYLRAFVWLDETCLLEPTCLFCLSLSKSVCLEVEIWPTTPAPLADLDPTNIYSLSNTIYSSLLLSPQSFSFTPCVFLSVLYAHTQTRLQLCQDSEIPLSTCQQRDLQQEEEEGELHVGLRGRKRDRDDAHLPHDAKKKQAVFGGSPCHRWHVEEGARNGPVREAGTKGRRKHGKLIWYSSMTGKCKGSVGMQYGGRENDGWAHCYELNDVVTSITYTA